MRIRTILFSLFLFALTAPCPVLAQGLAGSIEQQLASMQAAIEGMQAALAGQKDLVERQGSRIAELEGRLIEGSGLKGAPVLPGPPAVEAPGLVNWNPEVGVVGDVVTHLTEDTTEGEGKDSIAVRELELVFGQYVDPYSRFDAAIVFNDALESQNAEIEQAFLTRYDLPLGFKAQVGKIRPKIGKANLIDRHALDLATEPLVVSNFFGEEGWKTSGVRLQNFIPNPWDIPLEITGEVLNGRGAPTFSGLARRPAFNAHLKSFFDLSDTKSLELGSTALFGSDNLDGPARAKGNDRYSTHVFGFDATYHDTMDGARGVKVQNEVYVQDRNFRNPVSIDSNGDGVLEFVGDLDEHPWGFYSLLNMDLSKQWSTGVRFDWLKPLDSVGFTGAAPSSTTRFGTDHTWEISPFLTFHQSEFSLFRLQYSHTENAQGISDDQVYLQARFQIGVDRHGLQ